MNPTIRFARNRSHACPQAVPLAFCALVGLSATVVGSSAQAARIESCKEGWARRTVEFTPNIESFLDYAKARGRSWTEAQIRREMIAAAEEINHNSEANIRVVVRNDSTKVLEVDKHDGIEAISMCDPDHSKVAGCKSSVRHNGGGLANLRCEKRRIEACDIQFFHRGAHASASSVPDWRLQHEVGSPAQASRSVYRTLVHEMLHCLGLAHYGGPWPSVMNAGGSSWGNDANKYYIQHHDVMELRGIYGHRQHPIKQVSALDTREELEWRISSRDHGSTLAGLGVLQAGKEGRLHALFARVSDASRRDDPGTNGVTVYRRDRWGSWGHATVVSPTRHNLRAHGAPAFAKTDDRYVIAFQDHNRRIRISRSAGNDLDKWVTVETGLVTNNDIGMAHEATSRRLYVMYTNDANSRHAGKLVYTSSTDSGRSRGPLYRTGIRAFGGVSMACLNEGPTAWPCTIAYTRWHDLRPVWRPVRPLASDPRRLQFGKEQPVGVHNDFTSLAPTVSSGPSRRGPRSLLSYDRNGDLPSPDYAARALVSGGASHDGRSFRVDGWRNQWLASSYRLSSRPAIGHLPYWNRAYLFFTTF